MSHRKVLSQGNVPFSWEKKPGVSKSDDMVDSEYDAVSKIPLPPCRVQPRYSIGNTSGNGGRRWEVEDPFMVAYKECTKSVKNNGKKKKKSKLLFGFSCKSIDSCDIRDHSLFKLPKDTIHLSTWKLNRHT